jgi:hypothetical protein
MANVQTGFDERYWATVEVSINGDLELSTKVHWSCPVDPKQVAEGLAIMLCANEERLHLTWVGLSRNTCWARSGDIEVQVTYQHETAYKAG